MGILHQPFGAAFYRSVQRLLNRKAASGPSRRFRSKAGAQGSRSTWLGGLEPLEERRLLTTYTVLNNSDSGVGSLRAAIITANADSSADIINFDPSAFPSASLTTITLTTGVMVLSNTSASLTITGPGQTALEINGGGTDRVFQVDAGVTASLSGMEITGGSATSASTYGATGGAIYDQGALTITGSLLQSNSTAGSAGVAGTNGVNGGTGANGTAGTAGANGGNAYGGAITVTGSGSSLTLQSSTLSGNSATGGIGGNGGIGGKGGNGISHPGGAGGNGGNGAAGANGGTGGQGVGGGIYVGPNSRATPP